MNYSHCMKKRHFLIFLLLLLCSSFFLPSFAQEKVTLSGYIKDASNGEELIAALVYLEEIKAGTYTNEYGFYSLSVPPGTYTLIIRYTSFKTKTETVDLLQSSQLTIELDAEELELDEVIIEAEAKNEQVTSIEMSTNKLSVLEIQRMPQLLGEVDIIRSILLLPGISSVGEGATGYNARGGNVDQNLILLDEAPVYNSSHLFGFFSVFNADALKDLKIYKGGIPAKYGGRLSSVLDVRQKEGNDKRFAMKGGIGALSSRLTLEGPIAKEKASFMVAGRRSYLDLFLRLSSDSTINSNQVYFFDVNGKVNWRIGDKDRIYLSAYTGDDVFGFQNEFEAAWGNQTATLRWNHLFSDKLFSNFTALYSNYRYRLGVPDEPENSDPFRWTSRIISQQLKADLGYFINPELSLNFGGSVIFYTFKPGQVDFLGDQPNFNDFEIDEEHARESGLYLELEKKFGNRLTVQAGMRYSSFQNIGEGIVFQYEEGMPLEVRNITDTLQFDDGELIRSFDGWEPRLAVNYTLDDRQSFKFSYNRMRQYIHLVSNTTSATPLDVWKPSGTYVEPATVNQWAVGYFRNFFNNTYETSIELYYKKYEDVLDYRDGAQLLFNRQVETEFLSGEGQAYGAEFLIRKQEGRWTGWFAYTLSRSERTIPEINNGEAFPNNYDKTHDLSLVGSYSINNRWDVSANLVYSTGRPITYPDGRYTFNGITVPNYSNRNGARTPAYHRLDLSANYILTKGEKRWESSLSFGVYNVYGRRNAFSVFFQQNEDDPTITEAVQLSIFAIPIPYITYNFNF